ncbi:MAG TPA: hypothetical protein VMU99_02855 [Acidimicrobiales bacterium]|nr:hypothetical protein [Acidimicrobiales bacterium]
MERIPFALSNYAHTQPLISGSVPIGGAPLEFCNIEGQLIATFRRMAREQRYGISELGVSTALIARDLGVPFSLLPVFVTRRFDHEAIYVNGERIRSAEQLNGRRIGVRSYTVTDAVWSRAVLSESCGVDLKSISWVVTGDEHIEGSRFPAGVEFLPGDLDSMIEGGVVDAILHPYRGSDPRILPLFPGVRSAEESWYSSHGYVPIHHVIVIRDDVLLEYPWLSSTLFDAFSNAKAHLLEIIREGKDLPDYGDNRHIYGVNFASELFAADPVPYGMAINRRALEDLVRFASEQEIISDGWQPEDLFLDF